MNSSIASSIGIAAVAALAGLFVLSAEKTGRAGPGHLDAEYVIDGRPVRLVGGVATSPAAPGSTAQIVTRYYGNALRKDLDGDGREDVAFLVTQQTGGSGTFYYIVAALAGDRGSSVLLLGDRIAPQTTESGPGRSVIVNYAERAPGEPFSSPPSIGRSLTLLLDTESRQFGEVVRDFEGEADPAQMSLGMKTWRWIRSIQGDGREIRPVQPGTFSMTFAANGRFSATTDCNAMSGSYSTDNDSIRIAAVAATRTYCEGSQETEFAAMLDDAASYELSSRGELVLRLRSDAALMILR